MQKSIRTKHNMWLPFRLWVRIIIHVRCTW